MMQVSSKISSLFATGCNSVFFDQLSQTTKPTWKKPPAFKLKPNKSHIFVFGSNEHGKLGLNHQRNVESISVIPDFTENDDKVAQISAGQNHMLAVTTKGKVFRLKKQEFFSNYSKI